MPNQKQTQDSEVEPKRQLDAITTPEPEQISTPAAETMDMAALSPGVQQQANMLGRTNYPIGQQQQMAAQMAQTFGNVHMLQVMRAMKSPQTAVARHTPPAVQTKLTVNEPGDEFEQEADQVAEKVATEPDSPTLSPPSPPQLPTDEDRIQAKAEAATPAVTPDVEAGVRSMQGGGQPLPEADQQFFENRMGTDFSQVRIHTGDAATQTAETLQARAYTTGADITFNQGEYQPGTTEGRQLLAHELTHVVQQGGSEQISRQVIQRTPADYQHAEDGAAVQQRMQEQIDQNMPEDQKEEPPEEAPEMDRAELAEEKAKLTPQAEPEVDRAAEQQPQIEQAAQATNNQAETPAEPLVEDKGEVKPPESPGGGEEFLTEAEQAADMASQSFAASESIPEPEPAPEVTIPEPVEAVDSAGMPLPPTPEVDDQMPGLFDMAQGLREQGYNLRAQAAQSQTNVNIIRGNMGLIQEGIGQAKHGIDQSQDHLNFRRELAGQARQALSVSEEKAATVAAEAPTYQQKASEGKDNATEIADEAGEKSAENEANTPEDPEAAGNANEQGQNMDKVGKDTATIADAMSQTETRAGDLTQEAALAIATNTQTAGRLDEMDETLAQTDETLTRMTDETQQAEAQVDELAQQPDEMQTQAEQLDQQGQELIKASLDIEEQLKQVTLDYEEGMSSAPPLEALETTNDGGDLLVQRSPEEGRYEDRKNINLAEGWPEWLTGVKPASVEEQQKAVEEQEKRRQQQLQLIMERAGGDFESLSAGEKMGIALELTGQNLLGSLKNIKWPNWGQLALMLVDPRGPMMGVVGGLSKILSGGANLFSGEQWAKDPLGNLLKSAADIATGITLILGSITALAGMIIAIMAAITILSLGFAAPVTGPVIAFCAVVMTTVGGWTFVAGLIAAALNGLVLIKNLIDAATAQTAADLQNQSDQMTEDAKNVGGNLLQAGMGKLAQVGGRGLQNKINMAGGGTAFARQMPTNLWNGVKSMPERIKSAPGRMQDWVKQRFGLADKADEAAGAANKLDDAANAGNKLDDAANAGNKLDDAANAGNKVDDAANMGNKVDDAANAGNKVDETAKVTNNEPAHPDWDLTPEERARLDKRTMTREEYKAISSRERAKMTVSTADQPLDPSPNPNSNKAVHGHGHGDHGYQTTEAQQRYRIETGTTPSGRTGAPTNKASHFSSPEAEAEALGRARRQLATDPQATAKVNNYTPGDPLPRHTVPVTTNRPGGFGNQIRKTGTDALGNPIIQVNPGRNSVRVIFEYVPSKGTWEPVTYYPE